MQHLTIDEVEKEVEELNSQHMHTLKSLTNPKDVLCTSVTIGAPILRWIVNLLGFIKPKLKKAIQDILTSAEAACNAS